jgi:ATP-dependent Lon protease
LIGIDRLLTYLCKQNIKENIEGHAVDWYSDVFDLIFPDIDPNEANNLWKEQLKEPEKKKEGRMESEELEENNAGY